MAPDISVVVVSLGGTNYLVRCLTALTHQRRAPILEIIVPCDASLGDLSALETRFPTVQFLAASGRRTYAELRAHGFRNARGSIIALTEDHCTPDPDWGASIREEHSASHGAVGGAVEKQIPDSLLNWAVYLCDFSRYMNPVSDGAAHYLTDCNVSYKRTALASIADLWRDEFHETTVNWALRARGESLWLSPRIIVRQQRSLRLSYALWERYAFGRLFAKTRGEVVSMPSRIKYAGGAFLLPAILIGRIALNVFRKGRARWIFSKSLPAITILTVVWAWGELVGYITGRSDSMLEPRPQETESRAQHDRTLTHDL